MEPLTKLTSFIRFAFLCKDVSVDKIISSTGTLSPLKQNLRPVSNTECAFIFRDLDENLTTFGPSNDEVYISSN